MNKIYCFNIRLIFLIMIFSIIENKTLGQVSMTEEIMTIPTYKTNPPNYMPRFFEWRGHQGTQRHQYPYPVDDNLTFKKTDIKYKYINLENEYIDLGVMPNMGGRIYYAVDKTNNYNWFYHNHVVKPSLIGMIGNWVSGGNAWGYPHHHGPNTVEPMDYKLVENEDGSKTVWITSTDRRHRLSVLIGYSVFPNSSLVEMKIHPMNNTPISNSFLFWANPAVHVDSTYQVIFPPSVQYVTYHAKRDMTTWPIANGWYNNYDFTDIDVSWWKNTAVPSSFFSWDPKEGYFAGYDHGKDAGTVWIGNPFINPGMKYWADGNNAAGQLINSGLTDEDGQYLELMAGMYTDNQPDYSWIQPYESKYSTMIWFPIRELGGLKFANRDGALNFELKERNKAIIRMNTTSPHQNARVILLRKGETLFEELISISPSKPYVNDNVSLSSTVNEDELTVELHDSNNNILLSYSPADHRPPDYPLPEPLQPFPNPEEINTVEELYLSGLRLDQFYNPSIDPMPYYQEALKRDPKDYRTNMQLGIKEIRNHNWKAAEEYLNISVDRVSMNYTRPKDCEPLYYLAIVLREQGKLTEAYEMFYRASWDYAWNTASYYQLAEIDCQRGDLNKALEHIDKSLLTGSDNLKALNLKAMVLRKLGEFNSANEVLSNAQKIDILNHTTLNELYLLNTQTGNTQHADVHSNELKMIMRDEVQSYLELATHYMNCGFYEEAQSILSLLEDKDDFPMLYYYLGYCHSALGEYEKAIDYYKIASKKPYQYCFPFRSESIKVLVNAMEMNPSDARAPYYLGNLYYEHQPERAISFWEKARELDKSFYIVHRNLGLAYKEIQNNNKKAMASYEEAFASNSGDPRLLYELDEIYTLNQVSLADRYVFLKNNKEVAKQRSESLLRLVTRSVEYGKYDDAIEILTDNQIIESEGAREMRNTYLNAYSLRAIENLQSKQYDKAMQDIKIALAYPTGINNRTRASQLHYIQGLIYENMGDKINAEKSFQETTKVPFQGNRSELEYKYYLGLAYQKLGSLNEAKNIFSELLKSSKIVDDGSSFFTQFENSQSEKNRLAENHYIAGLANKGLGNMLDAKDEFLKVLELNPDHVWTKIQLTDINFK